MDTKIFKKLMAFVVGLFTCSLFLAPYSLTSCAQDDGNYEYLPDEEVSKIIVDTVGVPNPYELTRLTPGEHVELELHVEYAYPERLRYRWFVLKSYYNVYRAEQVGNAMVYPPADTICYQKRLSWDCDLEPGTYWFYFMAEDSINGMRAFHQVNYSTVETSGKVRGVYLLTERDGNTDIEVYQSDLMLIYNNPQSYYKYYSSVNGKYLEGKPRFIQGSHTGKAKKDGYLVATDKNLYRLSATGLLTVNTWNDLFYTTPEKFNPQASFFMNNCEYLINDGKVHVTYANRPNDRKFSDPLAGDYVAYPCLMKNTYTQWGHTAGAMDAWQVIYDQKNHLFRPYYSGGSSFVGFKSTVSDAVVDANNVPGDVKAVFQGGGNFTCVVTVIGGKPYLYRYNFYNVPDKGDFSAQGARSILDLSGCENIMNAKIFASNTTGYAFYYATDNCVYSFSTSSGETTNKVVHQCEAGEQVTALYAWGSTGGGFPTSDCALWIGIWNDQKKDGKLVQYEMDVNYGVPYSMWGPMFGAPDNPVITTGWGKIVSMTNIDAE